MDLLNNEELKETLAKIKANQPALKRKHELKEHEFRNVMNELFWAYKMKNLTTDVVEKVRYYFNKYKVTPTYLAMKGYEYSFVRMFGLYFEVDSFGKGIWMINPAEILHAAMNLNRGLSIIPSPYLKSTHPDAYPVPQRTAADMYKPSAKELDEKMIARNVKQKDTIIKKLLAWMKK